MRPPSFTPRIDPQRSQSRNKCLLVPCLDRPPQGCLRPQFLLVEMLFRSRILAHLAQNLARLLVRDFLVLSHLARLFPSLHYGDYNLSLIHI